MFLSGAKGAQIGIMWPKGSLIPALAGLRLVSDWVEQFYAMHHAHTDTKFEKHHREIFHNI